MREAISRHRGVETRLRPPVVLLLTATITPDPNVPLLSVRDPGERQQEYLAALSFYLDVSQQAIDRIVFAESSASDLEPFEQLAREKGMEERLQLLPVESAPPELGRGVGEACIIDQAMVDSPAIRALQPDQQIWKVTGRYVVRNLERLITTAPQSDWYVNLRRVPIRYCDTCAYAFTVRGYERYLGDAAERIRSSGALSGEFAMATLVEELLARREPVVGRFRYVPRVEGVRAADQVAYHGGRQRMKYAVRVLARRVAPSIWV